MSKQGTEEELAAALVVETSVADLSRSVAFYGALGFSVERRTPRFVSLKWGHHFFFLAEDASLPPPPPGPSRSNLRVLVPDVDAFWALAVALGARIEQEIADRDYGLRDFTIVDPDGFGIRFATRLATAR